MVEHALCLIDSKASLKQNLAFDAEYFFTDSYRRRRKAHASVLCPLGLSANDEFYLWGLLALTFAQPQAEGELHATPHYCLQQLGVIDPESRRGGRQYRRFREVIERLSVVVYRNDHFYDPIRAEHRRVSFGFLSYSLPLDPVSSRAWRIVWDPVFFEFVAAVGGHFRFELATYRKLDPAARRLFLFVSKVFARRDTTPRLNVRHLGEHVIGFSANLDAKSMKVKVSRAVDRLVEVGVLAPCGELFRKHGKGEYSLILARGPYFKQRPGIAGGNPQEPALLDPLLAIGFGRPAAERLLRRYPPRLLREWADITLAARERFGEAGFTRSPQAYFVDNVKHAAAGNRTPPDWWHEVRKAERTALEKRLAPVICGIGDTNEIDDGVQLVDESRQLHEKVRADLFSDFLATGATYADAAAKADRLARHHVRKRPASTPGLAKLGSLLRSRTS